jgi:FkbM family methyltransferase
MKIIKRIIWIFSSNFYEEFVLNYRVNDLFYIQFLNRRLKKAKTNCKAIVINDDISRYKIIDLKANYMKRFNFRKQGLLFSKGIISRGIIIAKDYHLDVIKFKKNDVVIDCGANTGDLYIYFENEQIDVNYIAIEPGKQEFKCLEKNVDKNKLFNLCLGEKNGEIKFYYKPEFGDSSIMKMEGFENSYISEITTLDELINKNGLLDKKIKLFKLEAEGAEPEICQGAINSLKNIEYISVDVGFERGIKQRSTAPDVVNFLLKNNFVLKNVGDSRMCYLFKNNIFES